ncbi:MAG TPA: SRPBCC domain-containing protein [Rhizomicrobium sp.]|nr:SRPBCC domain-containing protein [Rhizomicrobium sp.]
MLTWRKERNSEMFAEMHAEGFSRLTYELEDAPLGVKLTLTHEMDVDNSKLIGAVTEGWPAVLASLKSLLETGSALAGSEKWPEGI